MTISPKPFIKKLKMKAWKKEEFPLQRGELLWPHVKFWMELFLSLGILLTER